MVEEGKPFLGYFSNISLTEPMNVNVDIFSTKTYPDYMTMHIQDGKQTITLRPGQKTEAKIEIQNSGGGINQPD